MGVGIDLVEIARVRDALARRPGLAERVFTDGERDYAGRHGNPAQHLAARWAAKEAVAKALEVEAGWSMREVEVVNDPGGAPRILLHGAVALHAQRRGVATVAVSLTHARDTAGAVAMTEPGSGTPDPGSSLRERPGVGTPDPGSSLRERPGAEGPGA